MDRSALPPGWRVRTTPGAQEMTKRKKRVSQPKRGCLTIPASSQPAAPIVVGEAAGTMDRLMEQLAGMGRPHLDALTFCRVVDRLRDGPSEQAVLGAALAGLYDLSGLEAWEFHEPAHKAIFEAISKVLESPDPVTVESVTNQLKCAGTLGAAGGEAYPQSLLALGRDTEDLPRCAKSIRERAVLIYLAMLCYHVAGDILDAPDASCFYVDWLDGQLAQVRDWLSSRPTGGGRGPTTKSHMN